MTNALINFTDRVIKCWQSAKNSAPYSTNYGDLESPCIIARDETGVFWQPKLENTQTFAIVEEVMNLRINPAAADFYCVQLAGDLSAYWHEKPISLIQIWNQEDFRHFEANLLGHLEMQRKRKMRPTVFIATTQDESELISIDNQTGAIILENLTTKTATELAPNLTAFLNELMPHLD